MPRRKQKVKYSRKIACKHLSPKGDISNSLQPLCYCLERDLVLGLKAYVCQVCKLYAESKVNISDVFEESKKIAEKKIKETEINIEDIKIEREDNIDLSIDEFEEEEEVPLKFEKRKAGKSGSDDSTDFSGVECPFCGEIYDDLASHIQNCEFAPDDASIEDLLPSKKKRKRKGAPKEKTGKKENGEAQAKKKCPYCGKEFVRLGRHLNSCNKKPADSEAEDKE